jgi:SH3 domain-containing YSC84-like protein 1
MMEPTFAILPPEEGNEPEAAPESAAAEKEEEVDTTIANLSSPWEYDDLNQFCSSCASEFHPFNRKHHCRLCGHIFCGKCSDHKRLIPPSSIVLTPKGGRKVKPFHQEISFSPDPDPDRMLTYTGGDNQVLYGKGLEERFQLARDPLRVCRPCGVQLDPLQDDLRRTNSNAMRYNHIDPTDSRRLFNSPLAFTLGHEIRKAAYTLNNLLPLPKRMGAFATNGPYYGQDAQQCQESCSALSPNLGDVDGVRIPARLLEDAKGVAVMTVAKGGFGLVGGEFGTGLVVARLGNGSWSAPSAIGTAGLSWGALIGAQVSDHVFLLMNNDAVELLFHNNGSLQLGVDVGVAVGPLGRSLEGNLGASARNVAPIYSYSLSKGLYAGVSLDGKVIGTRHDLNEKFYGRVVSAGELLSGSIPTPPAAQPLYEALTRCHVYVNGGVRRRQLHMEYGEVMPVVLPPPMMPPAHNDQHSYAGMSDVSMDEQGTW